MSTTQAAQQTLITSAAPDEEDGFNLFELLDVVLEQKWLIGSVTAAALAVGYTRSQLAEPIYEASTVMQIESQGSGLGPMLSSGGSGQNTTAAEIEIMRSRTVVGEAVNNLNLDISATPKYLPVIGNWLSRMSGSPSTPGFLGKPGYVHGNEKLEIEKFEVPTSLLGQTLLVRLIDKGYQLLDSNGKQLGQGEVGKPLSFNYLNDPGSVTIKSVIGKPGAEFFLSQASHLSVTQGLQANLRIFENKAGTGIVTAILEDTDAEKSAKVLNEIASIFVSQSTKRKAAEAEKTITFLDEMLPQLRKEVEANSSKLNKFRIQQGSFDLGNEAQDLLKQGAAQRIKLVELQQLRKEYEKLYTPEHPAYQALENKIKALSGSIGELESQAKNLPAVEQELLQLERDVKISDGIYTSLLNTYHQLRMTKEGKLGNVRVIDPALKPQSSSKPNRSGMISTAGGIGLVLGIGMAFLRNRLRPGIRHADDLEQKLGLNVFATIPFSPVQKVLNEAIKAKQPGVHLLSRVKTDDPAIESLRSLRTSLQFAMLDAPNNIVVLTGATPNIGKSFASVNFASVLAAAGKRVLLIDADMRKGHIHNYLGLQRGQGLSELISGSVKQDQVIHKNVTEGLDFISTGTLPPNPAELLMSTVTTQTLKTLSDQYDIVIIDTPPVLAVSDTLVLAPQAGTTFLLARADITTLAEVQETVKRLSQTGAKPSGVLFNGIDLTKRRYGYGYGYGYKYGRYRYRYRYQYRNYEYGSKAKA